MKLFVLSLLAVFGLGAVAAEPQKAELKIDIYEWGYDTVLLYRTAWNEGAREECDTLVMADGRLTYRVALTEPVRVMLLPQAGDQLESKAVSTVIFPGSKQLVQGRVDQNKVLHYTAKGSDRYFADAATVRSWVLPVRIKMDSVDMSLSRSKKEQREALLAKRRVLGHAIDSLQLLFLGRFPSSPASGELLGSARYTDQFFSYEKRLAPKVRGGWFKAQIDQWVARERAYLAVQKAKEVVVVGVEAPPIELPDSSGVVRTLAEWRGKWVVVDFWGSWCVWCVKGVPSMKAAYEKHRDKVEILGVACRDTDEKWRAAVEEYALPWVNVFEGRTNEEAVYAAYGVEGYPTKMVVDPQGKIALKVVGEDPNFYIQLDQLIEKK